jgi:hypothetical protein
VYSDIWLPLIVVTTAACIKQRYKCPVFSEV